MKSSPLPPKIPIKGDIIFRTFKSKKIASCHIEILRIIMVPKIILYRLPNTAEFTKFYELISTKLRNPFRNDFRPCYSNVKLKKL